MVILVAGVATVFRSVDLEAQSLFTSSILVAVAVGMAQWTLP